MDGNIVIQSAKLVAIQDYGRCGYEHYGLSVFGAQDRYAHAIGNTLVGNAPFEPSLEITVFDFSMTSTVDILICVTGAPADVTIDSIPVESWTTAVLPSGKTLSVRKIRKGLRAYVAIGGGIVAQQVYGSCCYDTVREFGPKIASGQQLQLRDFKRPLERVNCRVADEDIPNYGSPWTIRVCDGPDEEIFRDYVDKFYHSTYTVTPQSNHIGIRLQGPSLAGFSPSERKSRAIPIGAVEIVPSGQPIIVGRGRTVSAGYQIIAVTSAVDVRIVGQARPGDVITFRRISVDEAVEQCREHFDRVKRYSHFA